MPRQAVEDEIARLEQMSKRGESYADASGRFGWRNPIRADTGPLLQELVAARDPQRMLEVGTAHGLSGLHLLSGLSSWEGRRLDTIELHEAVGQAAQARFRRLGAPAEVHIGEAMDVIARRLDQPYDLVFLDAQKSHYADQCSLLRARGLMGSGTLLLADNVVDRAAECATFFAWLEGAGLSFEIRPTECGLLVTTL